MKTPQEGANAMAIAIWNRVLPLQQKNLFIFIILLYKKEKNKKNS